MRSADWRAMHTDDLPEVLAIAAEVHPDLPEDRAVFAERLRLAPEGCLLLGAGAGAAGYVVSHPWQAASLPALNARLGTLPARPDCWYLHDIALRPAARGTGAAAAAVAGLARRARAAGLDRLVLVSIAGAAGFWGRLGFVTHPAPAEKLASYGPGARCMTRVLPA